MNPGENSSESDRKVVYLYATGFFRKELPSQNFRNRYPPHGRAVSAGRDIDPSNQRGSDLAAGKRRCGGGRLDEQIRVLEATARKRYLAAIQTIGMELPSGWFKQYLEQRILPAFSRIGFDDGLTRALFSMAASHWQWMGPVGQTRHWCHPDLIRELEEIRNGIVPATLRRRCPSAKHGPTFPIELLRTPGNDRCGQPDTKSNAWLMLPRVYRHLSRPDCRYLPAYLSFIEREINADCARIFIRSMIQFTANYALKFAAKTYPRNLLAAIVINGYETMFWKNLRSPPEGFEEAAVFEGFLTWTNTFPVREIAGGGSSRPGNNTLDLMKAKIFPPKSGRFKPQPDSAQDGRYLVALRHGSRGLQALQDYFGQSPILLKKAGGTYIHYPTDLRTLNAFLHSIKEGYHRETAQTQRSIRRCLAILKSTYQAHQSRLTPPRESCRFLLGFVGSRAVAMIQTVCDDL